MSLAKYRNALTLMRQLVAAQAKTEKAYAVRAALPAGSSRAKVTTANARWMRAAEHRDRLVDGLEKIGVSVDARAR